MTSHAPRLRVVNGTQIEEGIALQARVAIRTEPASDWREPRREDADVPAMERLIALLEAGTPQEGRIRLHLSEGESDSESYLARLQVARAARALASLEASGRIQRLHAGSYILRPREVA